MMRSEKQGATMLTKKKEKVWAYLLVFYTPLHALHKDGFRGLAFVHTCPKSSQLDVYQIIFFHEWFQKACIVKKMIRGDTFLL